MAVTKTVNVETTNARASTTLTDTTPTVPLPDTPQGLMVIGPQVTLHFVEGEWDKANSYDYYDVVQVDGTSYIAVQDVPANTTITNTDYWAKWNDPNAQVELLQQTVNTFDGRITENSKSIAQLDNKVTKIEEQVSGIPANGMFGIATDWTNQSNSMRYVYSPDGINFYDAGAVNQPTTKFSDASNLFEYNGYIFYCSDITKQVNRTTDFETWTLGVATNFPQPLQKGWFAWAPKLFLDASGNVKLAVARQYKDGTVANNVGGNDSHYFRIDIFDVTIDGRGNVTVGSKFTSPIAANNNSYIDPYIVYTEKYGYVMGVKNEITSQIEIFAGASLNAMTQKLVLPPIGVEAPIVIANGDNIAVYMHGYALRSIGSKQNAAASNADFNNYPNCYLRTTIATSVNNEGMFTGQPYTLIKEGFVIRHMGLLVNSKAGLSYVAKHGYVPGTITYDTDYMPLGEDAQKDVYVLGAPFTRLYGINGNANNKCHFYQSPNRMNKGLETFNIMGIGSSPSNLIAYVGKGTTKGYKFSHDQECVTAYVDNDGIYLQNNLG